MEMERRTDMCIVDVKLKRSDYSIRALPFPFFLGSTTICCSYKLQIQRMTIHSRFHKSMRQSSIIVTINTLFLSKFYIHFSVFLSLTLTKPRREIMKSCHNLTLSTTHNLIHNLSSCSQDVQVGSET